MHHLAVEAEGDIRSEDGEEVANASEVPARSAVRRGRPSTREAVVPLPTPKLRAAKRTKGKTEGNDES